MALRHGGGSGEDFADVSHLDDEGELSESDRKRNVAVLGEFAICMDAESGIAGVRHSFDEKYYYMREYGEIDGYCAAVCCQESGDIAYDMIPVESV